MDIIEVVPLCPILCSQILFDMSHGAGDLWKQTDARASLGMGGSCAPFVLDNWSSSLSGFKFQGLLLLESPPL